MHPQSAQSWDSIGVHYFTDKADMVESVTAPDYVARMQPHMFSDSAFIFEFTTPEPVFDSGRLPEDGALKVVNFLKARPGMSAQEFTGIWRDEHTHVLLDSAARRWGGTQVRAQPGILAGVVDRGRHVPGTLFEMAQPGGYSGVEEICVRRP